MSINDTDFKNMAADFINGILARKPPAATPEERLFLDYLRKLDEDHFFDQTSTTSGSQNTG